MTRIIGTVADIADRNADGILRVTAPATREGASGKVIDRIPVEISISNGVIAANDLDPGPATLVLDTGGAGWQEFEVVIPDLDEVGLWVLLESQVKYEPAVVSQVYEDRLKAEAAARLAEEVAAGIGDVADDVAAVAADRAAVETARTVVEAAEATVTSAESTATTAASQAGSHRQVAETARDDAVEARTGAVAARDEAEDFRALSSALALTATQKAEEAEAAALEAAGYVGSVVDGAITTPKLAEDAVTSSKLAPAVRSDLAGREQAANKGQANGYAPLDAGAKVPAAHLPSYVDDVVEFANQAGFPASGESGKIYTALDTNRIYRWSGSAYVEISPSPGSTDAVPEGATNKYYTDARARAAVADDIAAKYTKPASGIPASDLAVGRVVGSVNGTATNLSIWVGTEAQYTAIGTKDPNTLYFRT
ncbi:hypothetical protein ACLBYD_29065 [Rhodococcus sp. C26F]